MDHLEAFFIQMLAPDPYTKCIFWIPNFKNRPESFEWQATHQRASKESFRMLFFEIEFLKHISSKNIRFFITKAFECFLKSFQKSFTICNEDFTKKRLEELGRAS